MEQMDADESESLRRDPQNPVTGYRNSTETIFEVEARY